MTADRTEYGVEVSPHGGLPFVADFRNRDAAERWLLSEVVPNADYRMVMRRVTDWEPVPIIDPRPQRSRA